MVQVEHTNLLYEYARANNMKNWQVSYKSKSGKVITKFYANMNTATQAVAKLATKGIKANYGPVYRGGMDI